MKNVLIIGASGGIGGAIAAHHMTLGDSIIRLSRSIDGLDITDTQSVTDHLGRLDRTFDRVIVATGALSVNGAAPEKTIKSIDPVAMADQFAVNAIGPALILAHASRLLRKDRASVFSVLSAKVGSIGDNRLGGWVSYRVVALHPGTVETPFTSKYLARHASVPAGQAAANLVKVMDDLTPAQSGGFYDYSGTALPW
jgi:nucleoside-diphosphate-sugar epimerase